MENTQILKRHRWSTIRRAQVLAATGGALVTITVLLYDALPFEPARNSEFAISMFQLYLLVTFPADGLAHSLGCERGLGLWEGRAFDVIVNTFISFCVGSLIGWVIAAAKRKLSGRKQ